MGYFSTQMSLEKNVYLQAPGLSVENGCFIITKRYEDLCCKPLLR